MRFRVIPSALLYRLAIGFHGRFCVAAANVGRAKLVISFGVNPARLFYRRLICLDRGTGITLPRLQEPDLEIRFRKDAALLFDGGAQLSPGLRVMARADQRAPKLIMRARETPAALLYCGAEFAYGKRAVAQIIKQATEV